MQIADGADQAQAESAAALAAVAVEAVTLAAGAAWGVLFGTSVSLLLPCLCPTARLAAERCRNLCSWSPYGEEENVSPSLKTAPRFVEGASNDQATS
ncbi:MAG: hypothetical protein GY719_34810 [bacterium]|nr:hypothetical protein [bacterium]